MALNKLTADALVDGTLDADAIGTASITTAKLHSNIISGQSAIGTVDASNDLLLIYDNDATSLKKVPVSSVGATNTDSITEGSSNLYYTNARADARAQLKIDALVDSAPGTLDTLNELAAALGDDANFSTTVTNSIATKMPLVGGTFTGDVLISSTNSLGVGGSIGAGYAVDVTGLSGYEDIIQLTAVGTNIGARINLTNTGNGVSRINATNNSLALQTSGVNALVIDSNQNVGIGTNNPAGLLSLLKGTRTLDIKLETSPATNDMGIQFRAGSNDYIGIAGPTGVGLCIDNSNQVGIGTGDPIKAPLDVKGAGTLGYPANGVDLPAGRRINLYHGNQDHMIGMGSDGMFFTGNTAIRFQYKSGTNAANGTNVLVVDMANGRIGVGGVATPSARIEVASTTASNTTSVAAIGGGSISTDGDTVTGRLFWKGTGAGTDLYGVQNEANGLTIYNYTDNQYRIYFRNNGYTGIGTTNPSGQLDVEWSANAPSGGINLKNTNTGTSAYTGTYYGNTASDTDAFVGLLGANNPSYAGARSFLLGTNSSGAVATMVGGTQVHTVAQASASADGYSLTTPALAQTNQLYNMSGTILFDTINNNGLYQPMDYANAIKRYANIGSPTFRGSASTFHNSHSGSVFNSTWCANRELFDMRMGVHFWRVPKSGTYTLTARGAGYTHTAGNGRSLTMDYVLYAGEWLRVVCGAQGEGGSGHCGGAGATAFSTYRQGIHIPILVAGGGAGTTPNASGANTSRDARAPSTYGNHTPYVSGHYGARDGIGGHGSIYQHNYGSYIVNWGGGGGGGWATPGAHGGIGINMQEQCSGGAALSSDCPHGGYYQNGNAYHGGFGGGGGSGISSGAAGGGGGWYGGNSTYAVEGTTADDTDYQGGGSYAAGSFTDNGAHQSHGQALIQI